MQSVKRHYAQFGNKIPREGTETDTCDSQKCIQPGFGNKIEGTETESYPYLQVRKVRYLEIRYPERGRKQVNYMVKILKTVLFGNKIPREGTETHTRHQYKNNMCP